MSLKLIDISHYQNLMDPRKVESEDALSGILCKATQGIDFTDPTFAYRARIIPTIGLVPGAYHFYDPTVDPEQQAIYFSNTIKAYCPLIPALDLEEGTVEGWAEYSNDKNCSNVENFIDEFLKHFVGPLHIYSRNNFMTQYLKGLNLGKNPRLKAWVCDWESKDSPILLPGFDTCSIWQKSPGDTETGIIGSEDLDEFNGTLEDLKALCVTEIVG